MQPYSLPVPFEYYAYGASAALVLSFLLATLFATLPGSFPIRRPASLHRPGTSRRASKGHVAGKAVAIFLLMLCLSTGLLGSQNPYANFSMTFFWIIFVLGLPYSVALAGDYYAALNPWRALTEWLESAFRISFDGRIGYPPGLSACPAFVLYVAFICVELFAQLSPRGLSIAILAYTLITLAGAYVFGRERWLRNGEFFGVFLDLIGRLSPYAPRAGDGEAMGRRAHQPSLPFVGVLALPVRDVSIVLFILFMLASTAFDGLHSTLVWVTAFWKYVYPSLQNTFSIDGPQQFRISASLYYVWQWLSLLLSPFVFFAVFFVFTALSKALTTTEVSTRELMIRFAPSLIPIALAYHLTHYLTAFLAQAASIVPLASDPFGFGWNLFGTAKLRIPPFMLGMDALWPMQVGLIVAGHVISVCLAHLTALGTFANPRDATLSQVPMLLLMIGFTNFGLWILSLPLSTS